MLLGRCKNHGEVFPVSRSSSLREREKKGSFECDSGLVVIPHPSRIVDWIEIDVGERRV
jgi:hypothetical protein